MEEHFRNDGHDRRMFMEALESNTTLTSVYLSMKKENRSNELDTVVNRVVERNLMMETIRKAGWEKSLWSIVLTKKIKSSYYYKELLLVGINRLSQFIVQETAHVSKRDRRSGP